MMAEVPAQSLLFTCQAATEKHCHSTVVLFVATGGMSVQHAAVSGLRQLSEDRSGISAASVCSPDNCYLFLSAVWCGAG